MTQFGEDYKHFNVQEFYKRSFKEGTPKETFLRLMYAEMMKQDQTGDKLLELGAGPSLYTSLLASKFYNEIILSEYAEPNRVELMKWLKQEEGAFDWGRFTNLISQLEENEPEAIEKRTRSAIKDVLPCDITKAIPVPPYTDGCFDCIISCLTLLCSFKDLESYENGCKKVADLLVPGGKLFLLTGFGLSYYPVGDVKFSVLMLTKEDVHNSLKKAGFSEIEIVPIHDTRVNIIRDNDKFAYVTAKKPTAAK